MDKKVRIISVRENPGYKAKAVEYISSSWSIVPRAIYADSIEECLYTASPLPQWYLLEEEGTVIGCAGLITNDFISRMDLYPWVAALYIEEGRRGRSYGKLLLERCAADCETAGFRNLYLTTDLTGYYEKYGFSYMTYGYGTDGEKSHIYYMDIKTKNASLSTGLKIRPECPEEFPEIYGLIKTAFETAKVSDGDEQDFADGLRQGHGYIPELALVAEDGNGSLIGHIMMTKTSVRRPDGSYYEGLLVAPLSVLAQWRDKGVGSALMLEAFRRARAMGWMAAFLCGDPAYYHRFGFRSVTDFGISMLRDVPPQFVMAAELEPGALEGITGTIDFC